MRPKYKIGDTVFYTTAVNPQNQMSRRQSFGIIKKIRMEIEQDAYLLTYEVNGDLIEETDILGRAVIQKPRVRASRSKKAMAERATATSASQMQATG